MIIRRERTGLLFITQPDHAALAAELMAAWRLWNFAAHPRREAILLATREHDNGWLEEDEMTHVDAGGEPIDFVGAPAAVKHRIWPRAVARAARHDPYVGALVAHHATAVHAPLRDDPAWRIFLAAMARERDALLAQAGADAAALTADYRVVQAGDQLSLVFCNAWRAPMAGPGVRTILNGTRLEVTPDPFDGQRIPFRVPARRLAARPFASAAALRAALAAAPVEFVEGEAAGR